MESVDKLSQFRELTMRHPENELYRFSLAKALYEEKQFPEAVEEFQMCIKKKSDWMVAHILLAKCLLAMNEPLSARETLEKALELAIAQNHEGPQEEIREMLGEIQS